MPERFGAERPACRRYAGSVDEVRCLLNRGPHPKMIFMQRGATRSVFNQRMYDHLVKEAYQ
jgi:hypothetical protein